MSRGGAAAVIRRRGVVALAWLVACAALAPLARQLDRRLVPAGRVPGSESERVERLLDTRFGSPFARYAVLVASDVEPGTPAGAASLATVVRAIERLPLVTAVVSPASSPDTLLVGSQGRGAVVLVGIRPGAPVDDVVRALRAATAPFAEAPGPGRHGLSLRWTGEDPLNLDLRRASSDDVRDAEARALPVTALLLFLAFGGVVAALLPVAAGVVAIVLSLGVGALIAARWNTSLLYQNVVSILGLALGIDYALLVLSRVREARRDGLTRHEAVVLAVARAGRTVALSGAAVAVGFAALLAVPLDELRSVGAGGLVVTAISVLVATTLLPAILAWLGDRVGHGRDGARGGAGEVRAAARWGRWSAFVTARPWTVLLVASLPLAALGWQVRHMATALPSGDWLPRRAESARAVGELEAMGRGPVLHTARVVLELPPGVPALSPAGWAAAQRLSLHLARDARVGRVRSLPVIASATPLELVSVLLPDSARRIFVSADSALTLVEAVPGAGVTPTAAIRLVRHLRAVDPAVVTGLPGTRLHVGGLPAFNADYEDVVGGHFRTVIGLVLGGTFLALLVGFRSVLVPVKAIAMNLLTVAAAYGAVVLVFQDGHGARLLGLDGPLDAVFPTLPILVFCTVFGISMDYEVFLLARVAEARRAGLGEREAIARGLATTGGVITSAAAVMIAVFGAFALGEFLPTKMLGFALAVAVFADATLVRLAIGPALLSLAGRWNWWPGHVADVPADAGASQRARAVSDAHGA